MLNYFTENEIAKRYHLYRPRVHTEIITSITPIIGDIPKNSAIDIACGTGHSTFPLLAIADKVTGIDSSSEMLAQTEQSSKITYLNFPAENIESLNEKFDLISISSAYHWFEQTVMIKRLKSISKNGAYWLIYTSWFDGPKENPLLKEWLKNEYLTHFPAPPRGKHSPNNINDDKELQLVGAGKNDINVKLTKSELSNYLTTQSNVIAAVKDGIKIDDIDVWLMNEISNYFKKQSEEFIFPYRYEIYSYKSN
jgi:SAM-dependent methyltransferase